MINNEAVNIFDLYISKADIGIVNLLIEDIFLVGDGATVGKTVSTEKDTILYTTLCLFLSGIVSLFVLL